MFNFLQNKKIIRFFEVIKYHIGLFYGKLTNNRIYNKTKNAIIPQRYQKKEENRILSEEKKLFQEFIKFKDKTLEQVIVQRSDIIGIDCKATLEDLNKLYIKNSFNKIFIYRDTLDNIIGFIEAKDLLKVVVHNHTFQLNKIINKTLLYTPAMKLLDLYIQMELNNVNIAIIIDEYGATQGIVFIKKLLQQVFRTSHGEGVNIIERNYTIINANTLICNNRLNIQILEKLLDVQLKEEKDEFDTIGGLILARVGVVPNIGTKIGLAEIAELEVIEATSRAVKKIKLVLNKGKFHDL